MGFHFRSEHFQRSLINNHEICDNFCCFGHDGRCGRVHCFYHRRWVGPSRPFWPEGRIVWWCLNWSSCKSYSRSYKTHKYRYGRSIEDEQIIDEDEALSNAILDASLKDAEDCAKKLICSLNAKEVSTLASDESAIAELFGKSGSIDVSAATAEFDLAALMGRQAGKAQCETIYARCPYESKDLMEIMRREY